MKFAILGVCALVGLRASHGSTLTMAVQMVGAFAVLLALWFVPVVIVVVRRHRTPARPPVRELMP